MYQQSPTQQQAVTRRYRNASEYARDAQQMGAAGFQVWSQTPAGTTWGRVVWAGTSPPIPAPVGAGMSTGKAVLSVLGVLAAILVLGLVATANSTSNSGTSNSSGISGRSVSVAGTTTVLDVTATVPPVSYQTLDVRDLTKNPDAYKGKRIQMQGRVFNIQVSGKHTRMQIYVAVPGGSTFDEQAVVVEYDGASDGIYEKTNVLVYGTSNGTQTGKNRFGGEVTQPVVTADRVEIAASGTTTPTAKA